MFNIRAVSLDHYISKPIHELYEKQEQNLVKEWQEPVLRIFGVTDDGFGFELCKDTIDVHHGRGCKSCVHIHGVYPYIYVPYKGGENAERDSLLLGAALDEALRTSLNTKVLRFVHKVILTSGIPLYGYHSKHRLFFKIYFYSPFHIRKASDLLLSGAILGQKLQPHEAHIPYALQFMMDYNIYGMSFVSFSKVKYRRNPADPDSLASVKGEDILSENVKKMTWSRLEVDAWASDIINRCGQRTVGVNPGLQAIWEDEKERRRAQNRDSQITLQRSQSRPEVKVHPTEILYKARLAQKLSEISAEEYGLTRTSGEPAHSYPAEVPETLHLLEASAVDEGVVSPRVRESVGDARGLIDERILTQMSGSEKEKAGSESEEEMEFDSVLGRNQEPEEEAEPEDEEGVDMTQPLDSDDEVICGSEGKRREPGCSTRDGEETFWRNMADKIFQLDGALESSSESEVEAVSSEPVPVCGAPDGCPELPSAWSTNIMSILSECSDCPAPSATCPTPRTFWFDYSTDYLPPYQDAWISNKNVANFLDSAGKSQHDCLPSGDAAGGSTEIISEEPYDDLFSQNGGEYFSSPLMCNAESTVSPPSATSTLASEETGSQINLDSDCSYFQSPPKEKGKFPSPDGKFAESKLIINAKPENEQQNVLQVLKSFAGKKVPVPDNSGHLTLKQYIKDCKEIVSVDFKNLCNREMVIIEYKSENKKSVRNKYLIKPLDTFLESWTSAERKASDRTDGDDDAKLVKELCREQVNSEQNLHSNYVINVLEKTFSDASSVQSMSNKLTVKSMEILPDSGNCNDRCYNVNENVISRGEIKMKLIKSKSQLGKLQKKVVGGTLKRRRNEKCESSDLKAVEARNEKLMKIPEGSFDFGRLQNMHGGKKVEKYEKWKIFPEPDTKLINDINSSFEEYFNSIVKRKHFYRKRKKRVIGNMPCDEEEEERKEEEEAFEDERTRMSALPSGKRAARGLCAPSEADPIKFVTRFLSTFSQMSDVPPLSITIRLGDSRSSVPVKVNLRPRAIPSEKETKYRSRKHGRKTKIESVDGPADDSSSEESAGGESQRHPRGQNKSKRSALYKPLDVVVCNSPCETKSAGRKRKTPVCGSGESGTGGRRPGTSFPVQPSRGGENPEPFPGGGKKEKGLVKGKKILQSFSKFSSALRGEGSEIDSNQEVDFIGDSDEDRKRQRAEPERGSVKRQKKSRRAATEGILQRDKEALGAFDEDDPRLFPDKMIGKDVLPSSLHEEKEKGERANKGKGGVVCYEPSSQSEEVAEGNVVQVHEGARSRDPPSFEASYGPVAPSAVEPDSFQEFKTREWEDSQPGASLSWSESSRVDGSVKHCPPQTPFCPLTVSGTPLFASGKNFPESELTSSDASVHSRKESSATVACHSSGPLWSSEFGSEKRLVGSPKLDDAASVCFPSAEDESSPLNRLSGGKTIRPKRMPLDRSEALESMQRYGILESEEKAPFYGNPVDVTKTVDTGLKVLKIENRSVAGLKSFKGSLDIVGAEERRIALERGQKALRWRLVGNEEATITPLTRPPLRETVLKSFSVRSDAENRENAKLKIKKPLSPSQELDSDEDMDFSVTMSNLSLEAGSRSPDNADLPVIPSVTATSNTVAEADASFTEGPSTEIEEVKKFSSLKKSSEERSSGNDFSRPSASAGSDLPAERKRNSTEDNSFQIRGVTLDGTFGFSGSVENMENAKLSSTHQYMSMLVMEVHVQTRRDLRPDPEHDPIRALFYCITFDCPKRGRAAGVVVVGEGLRPGTAPPGHSVHCVSTEKALVEKFVNLVREWDPEILAGYEIEMHSWGYLVQRGFVLEMNLLLLLGRVQSEDFTRKNSSDFVHAEDDADDVPRSVRHMRISGRIVLEVWRVLRHEIALTSYTFESVMYHLSHERHPLLSHERLSFYWEHTSHKFRHLVVEHFVTRVFGLIRILDQLDFVNRTSELSRLFGIQFYEVLSRGSQFRVESMMLRLAKPLNYVAASPSVSQRASMRAPASLPLILEPESLFYTDPVVVLDFQSLYPSVIIAYNYCFSTCLGRIEQLGGREPFEFGCTQLQVSPEELRSLENELTVSPAGIAFVKSNIRKGVLPAMLEKILETRLMVKKSMKENKDNKALQKVLFARQLGLKLIANVTYGYTAANFSGRMPCIEVGDSVVSKGRETLHRAIQLVKSTREWGARVVYGDTDSIFVLIPGRSREEAFKIGAEIAEAVTRDNPKPVKLKLEKVYQPCILQTKKRYVGYMFESPDQRKPVFEAKGIETVRRDGCPAAGKILEKALRILFDTRDVSLVKKYTVRQFSKLYQGRVNIRDLIFAKEYRGRKGYRAGACVPALQLAKHWTQYDKRAEPRVKERVPYVIVSGPPGVPLIRLVRSPEDLIADPSLRINATYYISKVIIPAMQRCFSLLGVDVASWYAEMPRKHRKVCEWNSVEGQRRSTISQYFAASECCVCSAVTSAPVCPNCEKEPQALAVILKERIRRWERCHDGLTKICRSCCGRPAELDCVSLDCPVLFRRKQAGRAEEHGPALREILTRHL